MDSCDAIMKPTDRLSVKPIKLNIKEVPMKKFVAFLLAALMVLAIAVPALAEGETFLWDNFDDRDPNNKPELGPNGVNIWWDNWANLRAKNEDGAIKIDYRPKEYDPDYENNYCYFNRGIAVKRSNTTIYGIEHCIVGEDMTVEKDRNGDGIIDKWGADKSYGVPYSGFFAFNSCYNVLMRDCTVQGHQAYSFYQGTSRNEMGSYDLTATECINLKLYKVVQYENKATGEVINNRFMYHGVMGSNFCRNMTMDECYVDRFDAHQGLHNAKITNTTLGFGILVIGGGELYIENVYRMAEMNGSGAFISLRTDYNSVFDGDVIIKNCRMDAAITCIVSGVWRSFYNGLPNYITRSLMIDGLEILGNGKSTLNLYNISNASKDALVNTVNPLYVPESITVSNIRNSNGKDVTVRASKSSSDALSTITVTYK